jgi:hypothetical protein
MRKARGLLILAFLMASRAAYPDAGGPSAWFRSDPLAPAYRGVQERIERIFNDAERSGLPVRLLLEKLKEGAAKGVDPERLTAGLRAEADRLLAAREIFTEGNVVFPDSGAFEEAMRTVSIALLAGMSPDLVRDLFALGRPPARGPADAQAACAALIEMRESGRLSEEDLGRLGAALMSSRLSASAFRSIPPFFIKARARNIGEGELLDSIVIKVLESGGGLVQMEDALRLRLRRRGGS